MVFELSEGEEVTITVRKVASPSRGKVASQAEQPTLFTTKPKPKSKPKPRAVAVTEPKPEQPEPASAESKINYPRPRA